MWQTPSQPATHVAVAITLNAKALSLKTILRQKQTEPGLVAFHDIRPGNVTGLFLQPWSPHEADGNEKHAGIFNPCDLDHWHFGPKPIPSTVPWGHHVHHVWWPYLQSFLTYCTARQIHRQKLLYHVLKMNQRLWSEFVQRVHLRTPNAAMKTAFSVTHVQFWTADTRTCLVSYFKTMQVNK